jgi:hypothetical protein
LHFSGEETRREFRERHGSAGDGGCFQELPAGEM